MDKHVFTDKQKKLIAWAAIAIFLLLSAAVGWFIGRPLVRFASRPEEFRQWVDGHGLLGMAAYVGMVFLQVAVAVIPGEPLEISGGYAFGALRGSVLCLLGGVLGSVAVFALVRRFGRELVEIFFPREKLEKLKFLQSSPKRDALFWLIFTVPGTPKDLLCYFAGLTDLSWGKWLLLCTVGRLPSVLTSTIGGSALGVKDYQFAILVFAVTLAVSGVGLLIYRAIWQRMSSCSAVRPRRKVTISEMSSAWSPMRSMSVIIFRAAEIWRRSRATGCCCKSSFRHSDSMVRSFWSISVSRGATRAARAGSPSVRALEARAMTSSHREPISMSSRFSSASCWSNCLLIIRTSR